MMVCSLNNTAINIPSVVFFGGGGGGDEFKFMLIVISSAKYISGTCRFPFPGPILVLAYEFSGN